MPANVKQLFAQRNRGILLDIVVFGLNVIMIRLLTRYFIELLRRASADDKFAKLQLGCYFAGMFVLPASGAILKRWHVHQRRGGRFKDWDKAGRTSGCLFHPAFYLAVSLCISVTASVIFAAQIFGDDYDQNPALFLTVLFGSIALSIVQTVLVYRYFSPPRRAPKSEFFRAPASDLLGDACLYVNMILFQIMWNLLLSAPATRVAGLEDFAGRLFVLGFLALLIYFPPRIFYLAEDINRPAAWGTILLANAPTLLRVLFGLNLSLIR
ncbi:MAG: hypothetical protein ACJ74W_18055 [Pyrinomonadaceae bacterium]